MSIGTQENWMIPAEQQRAIIAKALDLGFNFFDTANQYSHGQSEKVVGQLLKEVREDVVIATKVFYPVGDGPNDSGLSRYHVLREAQKSLDRLETDHIDLYQIHRWDYGTPILETLEALDDLVHQGKVRYVGASSTFAWQLAKALFTSDMHNLVRFVSFTNHYNLCYREEEREVIPLCHDQGIAILPWSPLARGFLTGKYQRNQAPTGKRYNSDKLLPTRYFHAEDFDVLESVQEVAKEKGVNPSQIALAWLLKKGVTAPIIGVTKIEHLQDAVDAMSVPLSADDMKRLEEPYKLHPILEHS
jgi:1-deoxyxylulose-5-phosphate synthase